MALVDGSSMPQASNAGWGSLRQLNRYHWFVFFVVATAWMADCMDQQLFVMARQKAIRSLLPSELREDESKKEAFDKAVKDFSDITTSIFLIGWATGGLTFGVMGDRIGRVETLKWTIILYSIFTGLSAFSTSVWDFALYRFLTGLGVGGVFAVAVALLAETIPAQARPYTLGMLQSFSTVGNCSAGLLFIGLGNVDQESLKPLSAWQIMFLVGIVPAILVIFIQTRLKEPESWLEAKRLQREGKDHPRVGSYRDLFEDPRWRRHALLGALLAFSGVVGLWGIGFFSTDLTQTVIRKSFTEQGMSPAEVDRQVMTWGGITGIVMNIGALFGMLSFSWLTNYTGRRIAFAIAFVAAAMSTILVFWKLETKSDIFWMVPLMGFCQLALFGGYAIYLPELFPTRLRSTGTSFCYNVGRFVAAAGPLLLIPIRTYYKNEGFAEPQRQAAMTMCSVFALGFVAIFFLPETKGKPLPE